MVHKSMEPLLTPLIAWRISQEFSSLHSASLASNQRTGIVAAVPSKAEGMQVQGAGFSPEAVRMWRGAIMPASSTIQPSSIGFLPPTMIPALALIATAAEILLGVLLVFGWKTRITSFLSGVLLTGFALAMTAALGVKAPLNFQFSRPPAELSSSRHPSSFLSVWTTGFVRVN
jgi:methylamine utilization protein MauE